MSCKQLCHTFGTLLEIIISLAALCLKIRFQAIHLYCRQNAELAKTMGIHTCHTILAVPCKVSAHSAMQGLSASIEVTIGL